MRVCSLERVAVRGELRGSALSSPRSGRTEVRYSLIMSDRDGDASDSPLAGWARSLIGVIGSASAAAGTVAVFIKDTNVAGVPLLIVVGAGFIYVALTGQRLIQVNKDGVTFQKAMRLQRTLDAVTTDPTISDEAKERIVDVAEANGVHIAHSTDFEFERAVHEALRSIGEEFGLQVRSSPSDYGYDFELTDGNGQKAAVQLKMGLRTRGLAQVIRQLQNLAVPIRILVVDGKMPAEFKTAFQADGIWIVDWGESGRRNLVDALRSAGLIQSN